MLQKKDIQSEDVPKSVTDQTLNPRRVIYAVPKSQMDELLCDGGFTFVSLGGARRRKKSLLGVPKRLSVPRDILKDVLLRFGKKKYHNFFRCAERRTLD